VKNAPEKVALRIIWLMLCSVGLIQTCVHFAWFVFWEPALLFLFVAYLLLVWIGFKLINKLHYGGR
jgi:hypothetical protein